MKAINLKQIKKAHQTCTGCKGCMNQCPMLGTYCDSPKTLLARLADQGEIDHAIPFSCTQCGHCSHVCPEEVDLKTVFSDLRRDFSHAGGKLKGASERILSFHQKNSFSKIFATDVLGQKAKRVFFPGCSLTGKNSALIPSIYEDLRTTDPDMGILLNCCGNPTHVMGRVKKFQHYRSKLQVILEASQVEEIIVACPNCYNTLSNYTQLKIISLWDYLIQSGHGLSNQRSDLKGPFTIHDPCPTRYSSQVHGSIRRLIQALDLATFEMAYSKDNTLCCGSGGMVGLTSPDIARAQMRARALQAQGHPVITYCQECVESLTRGGQETYHILDFFYDTQKDTTSTLGKWLNRYLAKIQIKKML